MGRVARSWEIAKASARVLQADKELMALPLIGFVAVMAVAVVLGAMAWMTVDHATVGATTEYNPTPFTYVIGGAAYLLATFCGLFFTAALVAGAHERLTGGDPTVGSSISKAYERIGSIFGWSIVVTTVGLVLQALEERAGFLGQIAVRLVGMGWRVVTWLAVPIIVVEGSGPFASLKKSASMFRQTWGENLTAQLGFGLLSFLLIVPGIVVAGALIALMPIVGIALAVVWFAGVALALASLNGIYRAALYHYASTGQVPPGYPESAMVAAFAPRSSRLLG